MSKNKVITRTCSKCKKAFPVGQGHDARTCGKVKKGLSPITRNPARITKEQKHIPSSGIFSEEKQQPDTKTQLAPKRVPNNLFVSVMLNSCGGIKVTKGMRKPREWLDFDWSWGRQYDYIESRGVRIWFNDECKPHRLNGPAVEYAKGRREWRVNGKLHRLDGPAVEWADGYKEWRVNGELHRLDGPAKVYSDGSREWWVDGKRHREDGPAVEKANGHKEWWVNDHYHRLDGPAVEWADGGAFWYVAGRNMFYQADDPDIPDIMGEYFYLLCINSNPQIRRKALSNPNCPLAYKVLSKIVE